MVEEAEKVDGYEIDSVTRINRDFIDELPHGISTLFGPLMVACRRGKKLRVVMDYDPQEQKVELRYYSPT